MDLATEKAQNVSTGKSAHAMEDHGGIDGRQIRSFLKHHIGSPFILIDRPIVGDSKSTEHLAGKRIQLAHDSLKRFRPRYAELPVHQPLHLGDIRSEERRVGAVY